MDQNRIPFFATEMLLQMRDCSPILRSCGDIGKLTQKAQELLTFIQQQGWSEQECWGAINLIHSIGETERHVRLCMAENNSDGLLKHLQGLSQGFREIKQTLLNEGIALPECPNQES